MRHPFYKAQELGAILCARIRVSATNGLLWLISSMPRIRISITYNSQQSLDRVQEPATPEEFLAWYEEEAKKFAGKSFLDVAGDVVGSLDGGPEDLSSNPAHMADLGR